MSPPLPCPISIFSAIIPVFKMCVTTPFGRYHAGTLRVSGCANRSKKPAILRLFFPFQNFATDAAAVFLRFGNSEMELPVGIPPCIRLFELKSAFRDGSESPPLVILQLKNLVHDLARPWVPFRLYCALVLDFCFEIPGVYLPDK